MARFEQLVVSDRRDRWGIPRSTGTAIVNLDHIVAVIDATVDTTYAAFFDPACPAAVYPAVCITLRDGDRHVLLVGQVDNVDDADSEVDRFAQWLTGTPLFT